MRRIMAERKIWKNEELTCKPLDSLEEIESFLEDPPSWRNLCTKLRPHSDNVIKNTDVNKFFGENLLETPQTFCHYDPEAERVERHKRKKLPRTLVCHDMANGYHDDSVIDGTGNYSAYTFYNWGAVDVFCYFSHHFITIPPLGWINTGHAHGVKVIGTVITEWAPGVALWDRILHSEADWRNFASALVAIAKTLRLDGWLLNIENKISKPDVLLQFVEHLHKLMHEELEHPELIWYDSVTVEGHLNWQNGLNEKNRAFFDVVDGFFTNYSWTIRDVEASVAEAGERLADLYIGIDVWGRNFYGGGQFNTQEAVQIAFNYGCGLAIFAQAWTCEALSDDPTDINSVADSDHLDTYEKFLLRDRALWGSLWPYLTTKLPCQMPFQTSFCRGQGKKRRLGGEVICPTPWYNLNHMQYQPNCSHGPHGYLLSTRDTIANLSRLGLLKDKAGILRYRRSLEASRVELNPSKSSDLAQSIRADSLTQVPHEEVIEVPHEERHTVKRKMKDALRNLFKFKTAKTVHVEDKAELDTAKSAGDITGASMIQLSVNVRLGDRTGKTRYGLAHVADELQCLEPFLEDSFTGGSCLKVNPSDDINSDHRLSRIFFCDFLCDTSFIACVVTKRLKGYENQFLNVRLEVSDGSGCTTVVLVGRDVPRAAEEGAVGAVGAAGLLHLYPLSDALDPHFRELQAYLVLNEPGFYVPVANAYEWRVRYYEIRIPGARITSINCRTGLAEGPILLGHFGLCARKPTDLVTDNHLDDDINSLESDNVTT